MTGSLWLGVDVGGTFTDAVAYDRQGRRLQWAKVPSTPVDPALGVLDRRHKPLRRKLQQPIDRNAAA